MNRCVLILLVVVAGLVSGCSNDPPSVSPTAPEFKQPKGPAGGGPKSQFE
jgi:type IV pilus biogenesis protein CpaD/CtpE